METRRDVFQAIADPTRRAILCLIASQAMTPNAIAEHFDSSRQAVSKHIQVLVECDLLVQKQQGREIHYHINANKMNDVEKWLDKFKLLLDQRFNQLDELLRKRKRSR